MEAVHDRVSSMFWCRWRSTRLIPTGCRPGSIWRSATWSPCRWARAGKPWAWSGPTTPTPNPRLHNRLKDVADKLDVPPLKPELRQFVDWVAGYTLASRGMVLRMALAHGRASRPRPRARRRAARRAAAATHDRGARARARPVRRRSRALERRSRAGGRRQRRRHRRPDRRGHAGDAWCCRPRS